MGGSGLVGLGRTIFTPLCCYACLGSLWSLDLSCGPIQLDEGHFGGCHSTNKEYLSSLAYCMEQKCAIDGIGINDINSCWNAIAGDGQQVTTYQSNLPASAPEQTLIYEATSLFNVSLVNDQYYDNTRRTMIAYQSQEKKHALYSMIVLISATSYCFLLGLLRSIQRFQPKAALQPPRFISKYLLLPALIGNRHLKRLPWSLGYMPTRTVSLLVVAYITLNCVLCLISYPTMSPDTFYISSHKQFISVVSDRLGVLCFANIALAIIFAGRNNLLLWVTGANRSDLLAFHRWAARVAAIEGIAHSALYWSSTSRYGIDLFTLASNVHVLGMNSSYWTWGIGACIVMVFIVASSILPLRLRWYETFLLIHIALALFILVALWEHVTLRFRKRYGYEVWLYFAFAVWGFDRAARVCRIVLCNWKLFSKSHPSPRLELLPGNEFVKITAYPSTPWNFKPGQHCFLYFPTLGNPFQSHPFTISAWDNGNSTIIPSRLQAEVELGDLPSSDPPAKLNRSTSIHPSISFILRPEHGLTGKLHKQLLSNSESRRLCLLVEGPYGSTPSYVHQSDTILAIAGGIGITSIISYLTWYLSLPPKAHSRPTKFVLLWTAREESLITAVRSEIGALDVLSTKGVEMLIVCTGTEIGGRLDMKSSMREWIQSETNLGRKVVVVSCGPEALADEVRATVVETVGVKGKAHIELVEEAFCW